MKQISRLSSGRVPVKGPADVAGDRYQLLDLASAEPNLGTAANGSVLTTDSIGSRTWADSLSLQNIDVANNLTANRIYTDNLFFANGDPYIAAGSQTADQNTNIYNGIATVTTVATLVDTMPLLGNSTVRWTISSRDVVNSRYKTATVDSINNGATAYYNEYGVVLSDNNYEVATFTSNISSGNINLYATGDSANVAVVFQRMALGSATVPGYVPAGKAGANGYTGSAGGVSIVVDSYTGNGSTVNFTLATAPLNENQTIVSVGGILQPKSVYSVSGTTLTFSSAPANGVGIEVTTFASAAGGGGGGTGYTGSAGSFSGTTSQAIVTTNTTASTSTSTGALRVAGGAGIAGNVYVGGTTYVTGDILPTSNNTVNIGSATRRFGTLYLAANTIDLGGTTISTSPTGDLSFVTASGSVDITANTVNFLSTVATTAIAPGESGPIGYTGSRGAQGVTGYTGSAGTNGTNGYTGSAGTNGTNGTNGYTGSAGAGATSPSISAIAYPDDDTAADPAGGQTITLTGTNFASGASVIVNGIVASVVTVVSSTQITFTAPANAAGSYIVYVVNTNGTTALAVPGLQYSGMPVWTTPAGTLGTALKQVSFTANLVASGDAPVTYSLYSGTLPSGISLNANTGVISGTTPDVVSSTTYNFTIRSTDAQRQDTDRAFSITVVPTNPPPTVEYLVVAGGGGSSYTYYTGGGGGGGFLTGNNYSISGVGTPITVTVGAGGAVNVDARASNSSFGTITATGGGAGKYNNSTVGGDGGSGGGHGSYWGNGNNESSQTYPGGTGIVGQGKDGGTYVGSKAYYNEWLSGGGGGGAGATGSPGIKLYTGNSYPYPSVNGGNGGTGLASSISGTGTYYSGGGGGSGISDTNTTNQGGEGGSGGGGKGGIGGFGQLGGSNGTANTGGGGGGCYAGGSGIVIIRYSTAYDAAASTTGSPTYTVSGGYRIYKWTSSGSITF